MAPRPDRLSAASGKEALNERESLLAATDAGHAEMYRWMARASSGTIVEQDGLLLVAGVHPDVSVAQRLDGRLGPAEVIERALAFFDEHGLVCRIGMRAHADAELREALLLAGFERRFEETVMVLRERPDPAKLHEGAVVRRVEDAADVRDFARVCGEAFGAPEMADRVFSETRSLVGPGLSAFVAYLSGEPASCAVALAGAAVAGIFWVGTLEHARRLGLGEALTRTAAIAAFDGGASVVWLGASKMVSPSTT